MTELQSAYLATRASQRPRPSPLLLPLRSPFISLSEWSQRPSTRRRTRRLCRFPFARLSAYCAVLIALRLIYLNGYDVLELVWDRTEPSHFFRHYQLGEHGVVLRPWRWPVTYKIESGLTKQHARLQVIPELRNSEPPSSIQCDRGPDNPLLYVGVFSIASRASRRDILRKYEKPHSEYVNGAKVEFKFILGQPKLEEESIALKAEMEMHDDIVLLDEAENMNKGKSYAFFRYLATRPAPAPQFAFKVDDDALLVVANLVDLLKTLDCSSLYYMGSCSDPTCGIMRGWPFFFTGLGYGLTSPLYQWIGNADLGARRLRGPEDVRTGRLLYSLPPGEKLIRLNLDGRMGEWRNWRREEIQYDPETVLVIHGMKTEEHLKRMRDKLVLGRLEETSPLKTFSRKVRKFMRQ